MTSADEFTRASPTYIRASETNQARGRSYHIKQPDNPYAGFIILAAVVVILALGMIAVGVGNV